MTFHPHAHAALVERHAVLHEEVAPTEKNQRQMRIQARMVEHDVTNLGLRCHTVCGFELLVDSSSAVGDHRFRRVVGKTDG